MLSAQRRKPIAGIAMEEPNTTGCARDGAKPKRPWVALGVWVLLLAVAVGAQRLALGMLETEDWGGSEGTLGVITEATLTIHPLPEARHFHSYLFKDLHSAIQAARQILRRGLAPATLRISDKTESKESYKRDGSFMTISFDGFKEMVELEEQEMMKLAEQEHGEYLGAEPGEWWWGHRFSSV